MAGFRSAAMQTRQCPCYEEGHVEVVHQVGFQGIGRRGVGLLCDCIVAGGKLNADIQANVAIRQAAHHTSRSVLTTMLQALPTACVRLQ